jgi:hypothetical protein
LGKGSQILSKSYLGRLRRFYLVIRMFGANEKFETLYKKQNSLITFDSFMEPTTPCPI